LAIDLGGFDDDPGLCADWVIFLLTFLALGLIVFPYAIPMEITTYQAAVSPSALVFMIIFVFFFRFQSCCSTTSINMWFSGGSSGG
jgi:hypothetical protein